MWGAQNQPTSYPSGYGYVASAVVTANYTSGSVVKQPSAKVRSALNVPQTAHAAETIVAGTPTSAPAATATSVAIVPAQAAVAIGSTAQLKASNFNDGSTKDVTTELAWTSSDSPHYRSYFFRVAFRPGHRQSDYHRQLPGATSLSLGNQLHRPSGVERSDRHLRGRHLLWELAKYRRQDSGGDGNNYSFCRDRESHVRSVGSLIKTTIAGSNLTVRNSVGVAANAAVKGQPNGVFLEVSSPMSST